jgi:hypothetical protein
VDADAQTRAERARYPCPCAARCRARRGVWSPRVRVWVLLLVGKSVLASEGSTPSAADGRRRGHGHGHRDVGGRRGQRGARARRRAGGARSESLGGRESTTWMPTRPVSSRTFGTPVLPPSHDTRTPYSCSCPCLNSQLEIAPLIVPLMLEPAKRRR